MVLITKAEAEYIRKHFPNSHIAITNRQSSHKKYYAEETSKILAVLEDLRNGKVDVNG